MAGDAQGMLRSKVRAADSRCGKGGNAEGAEEKPAKVAMEDKQRQRQERSQKQRLFQFGDVGGVGRQSDGFGDWGFDECRVVGLQRVE